ncbi:MAG: hypothetical protein WC289_05610 [Patescibacteria group bacterium]
MRLSPPHLRIAIAFLCLVVSVGVLVTATYIQVAQGQWVGPVSAPPVNPGDPNIDAPLYGGSTPGYGGDPQARVGGLTLGQANPNNGSTVLYVSGNTLISDQLRVGTNDFAGITASIGALSTTGHGIYGRTSTSSYAGVYGTTAGAGTRGVEGSASDGGYGVYGVATGNNSYAIYGVNTNATTGYAGYFNGRLFIQSGAYTSLTAGNASFGGNVDVTGNVSITGTLTVGGSAFNGLNALSIQDQGAAAPATDPGVKTFTLSSDSDFVNAAKMSCVGCTVNGDVADNSTLDWTQQNNFLTKHMVVKSYFAQYSTDGGQTFHQYYPAVAADLEYRECNVNVFNGTFHIRNTLGSAAQFRLIAFYQEYGTEQVCGAVPPPAASLRVNANGAITENTNFVGSINGTVLFTDITSGKCSSPCTYTCQIFYGTGYGDSGAISDCTSSIPDVTSFFASNKWQTGSINNFYIRACNNTSCQNSPAVRGDLRPAAIFTMNPNGTMPTTPQTVTFTPDANPIIVGSSPTWSWTFTGTGTNPATSTVQNPSVQFNELGTQTATLIVTSNGLVSDPFVRTLTVGCPGANCCASDGPNPSGCVGTACDIGCNAPGGPQTQFCVDPLIACSGGPID